MSTKRTYELSFNIKNSTEPQKVTFDVYDGAQGEKGDKGEGFSIAKEYSSVEEMNADYNNSEIPLHSFVLISTDDVNDPDNAKLYAKTESGFSFLTDLSGAQDIKGEKSDKGDKGDKGDTGEQGEPGTSITHSLENQALN